MSRKKWTQMIACRWTRRFFFQEYIDRNVHKGNKSSCWYYTSIHSCRDKSYDDDYHTHVSCRLVRNCYIQYCYEQYRRMSLTCNIHAPSSAEIISTTEWRPRIINFLIPRMAICYSFLIFFYTEIYMLRLCKK